MTRLKKKVQILRIGLGLLALPFVLGEGGDMLNGYIFQENIFSFPDKCTDAPGGVIGLMLEIRPQRHPRILRVYNHTPASRAGLRKNDSILKVNGVSTFSKPAHTVDRMLPDVADQPVSLEIERAGERKQLSLRVTRIDVLPFETQKYFQSLGFSAEKNCNQQPPRWRETKP